MSMLHGHHNHGCFVMAWARKACCTRSVCDNGWVAGVMLLLVRCKEARNRSTGCIILNTVLSQRWRSEVPVGCRKLLHSSLSDDCSGCGAIPGLPPRWLKPLKFSELEFVIHKAATQESASGLIGAVAVTVGRLLYDTAARASMPTVACEARPEGVPPP